MLIQPRVGSASVARVQALIEKRAHQQFGRALGQKSPPFSIVDIACGEHRQPGRGAPHGDGSDSAENAQPVSEGSRTPQIERIGDSAAANLRHRTAQEAELGIEHARRADHRANLEPITGAQAAQHQCAIQAAAGAKHGAQPRRRDYPRGLAHSRRISSRERVHRVRICSSVCSLLMKNRSRAERSCTAG